MAVAPRKLLLTFFQEDVTFDSEDLTLRKEERKVAMQVMTTPDEYIAMTTEMLVRAIHWAGQFAPDKVDQIDESLRKAMDNARTDVESRAESEAQDE